MACLSFKFFSISLNNHSFQCTDCAHSMLNLSTCISHFYATANIIFIYNCVLLVSRNIIYFVYWTLSSGLTTKFVFLLVFCCYCLTDSLVFSSWAIILTTSKESCTSSFITFVLFCLFLTLVHWPGLLA